MKHAVFAFGLTAALVGGCSRNPATGRVQAFLISENEEIALGRENDAEITASIRPYEEAPELVALVEQVGQDIAKSSERPELPWTFRVLDEPAVNAFALPGGFVYVTRGLLVHLNSKAELAAVLGHEAGHVTARHGAVHLRKTNVARRSVGVFRVVDPNLQHIGGLAASVAGLALLKYSRDDEFQADDLAVRYVQGLGYDVGGVPEVFGVLSKISDKQGRVPAWLSTHPEPELRRTRVTGKIGKEGVSQPDPEFLVRLDGVTHGRDARDGFVYQGRYVQPRAGFRIDVPKDWETSVDPTGLTALAPNEDALFIVAPSSEENGREALKDFFAETGIAQGEVWEGKVDGYPVATAAFSISTSNGGLTGLVAFFDYGDQVIAVIAAASGAAWQGYADPVAKSVASFLRVRDEKFREVPPMRVRITKLPSDMTLAAYHEAMPSAVSVVDLARLNHVEPDEPLSAGMLIKRVDGFNADAAERAAQKSEQ